MKGEAFKTSTCLCYCCCFCIIISLTQKLRKKVTVKIQPFAKNINKIERENLKYSQIKWFHSASDLPTKSNWVKISFIELHKHLINEQRLCSRTKDLCPFKAIFSIFFSIVLFP